MKFWWTGMWTPTWSDEEFTVTTRIFLLALLPGLGVLISIILLSRLSGVERHIGAIFAFWLALPLGLYFGRKLAKQLWPDLVQKTDANAAKRLGK
jgi:hypothetical protein